MNADDCFEIVLRKISTEYCYRSVDTAQDNDNYLPHAEAQSLTSALSTLYKDSVHYAFGAKKKMIQKREGRTRGGGGGGGGRNDLL